MDPLRKIYETILNEAKTSAVEDKVKELESDLKDYEIKKGKLTIVGKRVTQQIIDITKNKISLVHLVVALQGDTVKVIFRPNDLTNGTYVRYYNEVKKSFWDKEITSNNELSKTISDLKKVWKDTIESGTPQFKTSMSKIIGSL